MNGIRVCNNWLVTSQSGKATGCFLLALFVLCSALATKPSSADIVVLHIDPPIPSQTPGTPPLGQLVFERTFDFTQYTPIAGDVGLIDVSRIGDFNNPTTNRDGNGAPLEGVAIYGVSQGTPGLLYEWVFWPGISGTTHERVDDPAKRQHLLDVLFSQDELIDTIDGNGLAHFMFVFGNAVDDAPYAHAVFELSVEPIPEPSGIAILGFFLIAIILSRGLRTNRVVGARI